MILCDLHGFFGQKRIFPIVEMGAWVQVSFKSRLGRRAQWPIKKLLNRRNITFVAWKTCCDSGNVLVPISNSEIHIYFLQFR